MFLVIEDFTVSNERSLCSLKFGIYSHNVTTPENDGLLGISDSPKVLLRRNVRKNLLNLN